ncbi:MAG: response regulator [Pirellula sp.]|jgi:carbon storage regulator CsrA|nr:response regulator [Pirellula sp.]
MLILSRSQNQSIVFPNCGITIHLLQFNSQRVKIGIDAPRDIEVYRGELLLPDECHPSTGKRLGISQKELHDLKNRLNAVSLGLNLYQSCQRRGLAGEADKVLSRLIDDLAEIDKHWVASEQSASHDRVSERTLERFRIGQEFHEPVPDADSEEELRGGKSHSGGEADSPIRILVVEDNQNERELLASVLELYGCECVRADDGVAAFEILQNDSKLDTVLLDMHMPRMNGLELLRKIRSDEKLQDLCVFSVSATSPSDAGIKISERGFDGWLPKPLHPQTVWKHVKAAVT